MTVLINKYFIHQDVYSSTADRMVEIKDIQEFWDDPTKLIYQTTGGTYYQEHELHESREVYLVEKNRIKVGDQVWFFILSYETDRASIHSGFVVSFKEDYAFISNSKFLNPSEDYRIKVTAIFKTKDLALRSLEE